jgi:peptidoglycan-N-acetylglucosamine deacetylase
MRTGPLIGSLGVFAAGAAAWSTPALAPVVPPVAALLRIPRRTGEAGAVAVTFDDGPHPAGTPAVLAALDTARASATFFLVGEQVERDPALAREIAAAGHSIAVHGYRHRSQLRLTPREFANDLERAIDAIAAATGTESSLYRPPYGVFSPAGLWIVRRRGLRSLLWSHWGHDWRARANPATIAAEVTSGVEGGDVLLLHDADHYSDPDSWRATAASLPRVLATIEHRGLRTARL